MNAVNAVQLFILLWTFSAVCQADDDGCSVSCDDVTGTVAKEVTFTCSVPQHCAECSIKTYKLQNPESYKDSITCNQELPNFTCRFTPTTEMKEKFKFFVQTQCGVYYPEFSVNMAGPLLRKADEPKDTEPKDTGSRDTGFEDTESEDTESEDTGSKNAGSKDTESKDTEPKDTGFEDTESKDTGFEDTESKDTEPKDTGFEDTESKDTGFEDTESKDTGFEDTESKDTESKDTGFEDTGSKNAGSKDTVIAPVVGLFVIIILIIILMTIICKKQSFRFQLLCIKHNDDNSDCPENVISSTESASFV